MQLPARDRDVVGWERLLLLRRRARNAPDQVHERRAVYGREFTGQLEAAPGIVVSAHHRAPQSESAKCTGNHHTTDASSVRGPRPTRSAARTDTGVPAPWKARAIARVRSHVHHHAHQRRVLECIGTPLTEPVSLKAATGIAGSVHHRGEGWRPPPGSSRRPGGHDEDWLRWRSPERTRAVNPLPTDRRQAARETTPLTSG